MLAAGIGSVCCIGPAVLAGLGFGAGAVSFARAFGVLDVPMTVAALSLLGAAFFLKFRKKLFVEEGNVCCEEVPGKISKNSVFLWTVAALVIVLLLIPYFL